MEVLSQHPKLFGSPCSLTSCCHRKTYLLLSLPGRAVARRMSRRLSHIEVLGSRSDQDTIKDEQRSMGDVRKFRNKLRGQEL